MYEPKSKGCSTVNSRYVRYNIDAISKEYLSNIGLVELAKKYGVAPETLKKALKDYGIQIRTRSEVKRLQDKKDNNGNGRKHQLDFNYFKTWSSEMAYIVGFIGADGSISDGHRMRISLQYQDGHFLEEIKKRLNYTGPINYPKAKIKGKEYDTSELSITSKALCESLIEIGITPRKSHTISMSLIPEEYRLDFIRGYFDGNGSIGEQWTKRSKTPVMRTRFFTGSETLAKEIIDELEKLGVKRVNYHKEKNKNMYSILYSQNASKKIYELFYKEEGLHLTRKKAKFDEIIKKQTI